MKTYVKDMTVGKPVGLLLSFMLPMVIGNVFQQFYNMVDSMVVGKYVGADALAAVGATGSLNFLIFSLCGGMSNGIGIIISQYFGAGNDEGVKKAIANAVYIMVVAASVMGLFGVIMSRPLLQFLNTPQDILDTSAMYMKIMCGGVFAVALYNCVAAILRAIGDSKTPLYFLIVSSIINVVLDLLFVLVFQWSVFGVALATIIAQAISAVACIIYAYKKIEYFRLTREQLQLQPQIVANSFKIGVPIALQNSMIAVSCMVLQGVVNTFGETIMASYTIIGRIEQIVQQPFSSLGAALTTYSGQNMGAGKTERVKKGFRQATLMVLVFSVCMIPIAYLFGEQIIGIFVKEAEVIEIGSQALRINSLCYFGLGMIYVPRAVLNGCGDTNFAMINGLTEVACRVLYSQVLTRIPFLGFWGIWLTTGATWVTTAVVCVARYFQRKWRVKSLVEHSKVSA